MEGTQCCCLLLFLGLEKAATLALSPDLLLAPSGSYDELQRKRSEGGRGKQEGNGFHFFSLPVVGLGTAQQC